MVSTRASAASVRSTANATAIPKKLSARTQPVKRKGTTRGAVQVPKEQESRHDASYGADDPKEGNSMEDMKKPRRRKTKSAPEEPDPGTYVPRVSTAWKIGAHVSAAGGVENAVTNAASIGANAFALFLKSQRKWTGPAITETSIAAFKRRMDAFGYSPEHVLPHGNYLVNLGNPDAEKREKSYECFIDELKRCEQLGLTLYNFHPGSTVGQCTVKESIKHIAQCINRAHKETSTVCAVIENMAGAGNVVCGDFQHITDIIDLVEDKSRVGVCLDTCHMFAAGYDLRTKDAWTQTMDEFDRIVGLKYLRGMHLNDCKAKLGSNKDRHENIGMGEIGFSAFTHVVSDSRTRGVPLILETPTFESDGDVWRAEIAALHSVVPDAGPEHAGTDEAALQSIRSMVAEVESKKKKENKSATKKRKRKTAEDEGEDEP